MVSLLRQFVSVQSVSQDPRRRDACWAAADLLSGWMAQAGMSVGTVQGQDGGNPVVVGRLVHADADRVTSATDPSTTETRPAGAGAGASRRRTVLFLGHYDVQPEAPAHAWKSPPF